MGRPVGSVNRQKPFADALRMEIRAGNDARHLRAITRKLIETAEGAICKRPKRSGTGWTVSARRQKSAATFGWRCCLTVNCSRSFGAGSRWRNRTLREFAAPISNSLPSGHWVGPARTV
jgi:hypothetical protein